MIRTKFRFVAQYTVLVLALCFIGIGDIQANDGRIQASNMMLYQTGRDPLSQEVDGTRMFDRVQLDYLTGVFRYGLRAEVYRTSESGTVHEGFTQKYVEWRGRDIKVRVGNSYATIGRGLLLRSFELPGVIREVNTITDSKYMDSRDLEGAVIEARSGRFDVLAITGRPLAYADNPPGLDFLARRDGTVSGGRLGFDAGRGVGLGYGYIRSDGFVFAGRPDKEEFTSVDVTIDLSGLAPSLLEKGWDARVYAEYAGQSWTPVADAPSRSDENPHALYTAMELSKDRWSLTLETKHYRDFQLPFNDAPNLVPELSPSLVNRRSHFLIANNERGTLLGLQGAFAGDWLVHVERADSRIGDDPNELHYRLNFLEVSSPQLEDNRVSVFISEGRDDLESLHQHKTFGVSYERSLDDFNAITTEFEIQSVERPGSDEVSHDILAAVAFSRSGLGSISIMLEQSDDTEVTDDPFTLDIETARRTWLGLLVQAPLNKHHELTVFAGKRRGGTACTSGTCYLVPDFEGVEARLISRF